MRLDYIRIKHALRRSFNCHGFPQEKFDDVYNDYILYRLEGKSKHQTLYHFVIDYFIREKNYHHSKKLKQGVPPRRMKPLGADIEKAGAPSVIERDVDRKMLYEMIWEMFSKGKMERKKRKIVIWKYFYGMTNTEIAKKTKLTQPRISQILKECVKRIKKRVNSSHRV